MTTAVAVPAARQTLDERCINTLRGLSIDMVQAANSGHPGLPLDAAPMAYQLWRYFLKANPKNPQWFDRDRFVLSAGHGSALLYSLLYMSGYDLLLDDIKQFRELDSKTPGHPERGHTPGVESTTGPLGQGFGNGVGMAIAEAHLAARFNRPGHEIINHYTYGIVSDGDLMEGISSEAASLAGHLRLGKLIYLYDSNHVTLSAGTDITFTETMAERFEAYGWQTIHIADGNDLNAINQALETARGETSKPSLIIVRTHIGYASPEQDSFKSHGSPLGEENVRKTKENLGFPPDEQFYVPDETLDHMREIAAHGQDSEKDWQERFEVYQKEFPDLAREMEQAIRGELTNGWEADLPMFETDAKGMSTRVAAGKIMNAIAPKIPALIGGSADLNPSTHTALKGMGTFECPRDQEPDHQGDVDGGWNYAGRNLFFGVREHAMGAILNGMAAHGGCIPYGATFLIFSDYMRPPMRLACMMALQLIYVFTHDSIALGQDGPTHQPIEQLAGLRAIPRLSVIRPADANETVTAWKMALEAKDHPTALILTRQDVPTLDRQKYAAAEGLRQGAYILWDGDSKKDKEPELILMASGSEVHLILEAAQQLQKQDISVRVVSVPSWDLFEAQNPAYREKVLPPGVKARLAVEAAAPLGWERYVGMEGKVIAMHGFGTSAPGPIVLKKFGFTAEHIRQEALALLKCLGQR